MPTTACHRQSQAERGSVFAFGGRAGSSTLKCWSQPTPCITRGLTRGSAPSTPTGLAPKRARITRDGFAAMPGRRFADRRQTVGGATGDEGPEAVLVFHRADPDAEIQGVAGGGALPFASPPRSTWSRLAYRLRYGQTADAG